MAINVALLCQHFNLPSIKRFQTEALELGINLKLAAWPNRPEEPIEGLLLRNLGLNYQDDDLQWAKSLEARGILTLSSPKQIEILRGKERQAQFFQEHHLPHPPTWTLSTALAQYEQLPEAAYMVKPMRGLKGLGIVFVESKRSLQTLLEALQVWRDTRFMVQIYREKTIEWRVLVTPERLNARALVLKKMPGLRGNRALNQTPSLVNWEQCPLELQNLVLKSLKACQLSCVAFDILQSEHGLEILEINSTPGFQSFEELDPKLNIAREILKPFAISNS